MIKARYDKDGVNPPVEVQIYSYDRDKRFNFRDTKDCWGYDKVWKFDVKWSNKIYKLPIYADMPEQTNKQVQEEVKEFRKKSTKFFCQMQGVEKDKQFRSLKDLLNFCKSNKTAIRAFSQRKTGKSSHHCPLLVKEGNEWFYYTYQEFVSEKTLKKFCEEN